MPRYLTVVCAENHIRIDDVIESRSDYFVFFLAVLASPFKSKIRLEAANAIVCTKNLNTGVVVMKSAQDGA
jgi:hypothetical protein